MTMFLAAVAVASATSDALVSCQEGNMIHVKDFRLSFGKEKVAPIMCLEFNSTISSSVAHPYLELRVLHENSRIPEIRYRDYLHVTPSERSGLIEYAGEFPFPIATKTEKHSLQMIFREKNAKLACLETSLPSL